MSYYIVDIFREVAVISRDDSRASKVIRLIRYWRNERRPPSCSLKCKTFSYHYARSRDTFFSKQVPHRISEGSARERRGSGRNCERGSERWRERESEKVGGRGGMSKRERESPHMKPLSAPIQQYFYIYHSLPRRTPSLSVTPVQPYPLI